jgi:hypothetical protein
MPDARRLSVIAIVSAGASLAFQPAAVLIAVYGDNGSATSGGLLLALCASVLLALLALVLAIVALRRLRGAPPEQRTLALLALVGALVSPPCAVVVGAVALLIASKGGWIYM